MQRPRDHNGRFLPVNGHANGKANGVEHRVSLEDPKVSVGDPRIMQIIFGQPEAETGETINEMKALGVAAYWSGVQFLSGTIASLPLKVFRGEGEDRSEDRGSVLWRLLHNGIGGRWTSFKWRKYTMERLLTGGRAYTLLVRRRGGQISRLVPLPPNRVEVRQHGDLSLSYKYRPVDGSQPQVYREDDILDLTWMLAEDGYSHISPISILADTLGLSRALVKYASKFFRGGGLPPAIVEGPFQSPGSAARAQKDVAQAMLDAQAAGRPFLAMPLGHTVKGLGATPKDSQLTEERRFAIEEVARILQLPPTFLQDLTHGTFSNTEQADLHVAKHTVSHHVNNWESEMNLKLVNDRERDRFVEFVMEGLLRGDFLARMQAMGQAVQNALITPNEGRRLENRPPKEGGDELFIQGATVPIRGQLQLPMGDGGEA